MSIEYITLKQLEEIKEIMYIVFATVLVNAIGKIVHAIIYSRSMKFMAVTIEHKIVDKKQIPLYNWIKEKLEERKVKNPYVK